MSNTESPFGYSFYNLSPHDQFLITRDTSDKVEVSDVLLPSKIIIGATDKEIHLYHQTATLLWQDVFQVEKCKSLLRAAQEGPPLYNEGIHRKLKEMRIGGVILRDANRFFLEEHKNPETLYNFIKLFGLFNDNFGTKNSIPTTVDVNNAIESYESEIGRNTSKLCSIESFQDFIKQEIDHITKHLGMGTLHREELHTLRRTNRRILNFFLLKTMTKHDTSALNIYTYLRGVNTTLGDLLDNSKFVTDQVDFVIPKKADHQISEFLSRIS